MPPAIEGLAQESADSQQDVRQRRLEWLQARADEFEIHAGDNNGRRLKRGDAPILRWSNPTREFVNDGAMFLYFDGGRQRLGPQPREESHQRRILARTHFAQRAAARLRARRTHDLVAAKGRARGAGD